VEEELLGREPAVGSRHGRHGVADGGDGRHGFAAGGGDLSGEAAFREAAAQPACPQAGSGGGQNSLFHEVAEVLHVPRAAFDGADDVAGGATD